MERRSIDSSALRQVGYDADAQVLEVVFASGRVYRYLTVPELVHRRLLTATSPGEYFNQEIRDRYECERVQPPRPGR